MKKITTMLFVLLVSTCLLTTSTVLLVFGDGAKVIVSVGKSYTSTGAPDISADATYGDSGGEMTDGVIGDSADGKPWTAYQGDAAEIVIDLEESLDNLVQIDYNIYVWKGAGLNGPQSISIQISDDNENWTSIHEYDYVDVEDNDIVITPVSISIGERFKARYVKLVLNSSGAWTCIDEITIYQLSETTSEPAESILEDSSELPESTEESVEVSEESTPITGDNNAVYLFTILVTIAASTILVIRKRKV
ncbi:MAG: discoidin domain-containing protein [Eubacteriales bacterium]|nr:discoidin domain-containing protein [Eubacteriales bacterium]MDD4474225.1 discoidin domain-containing protein [Eubacteriales bacterium]